MSKLKFPTHLRKMWSGSEVQAWIDEHLAEQAEQEPVAWVWLDDWLNDGYPEDCFSRVNHQNKTPLYAAPIRTKDLTDEEIDQIYLYGGRESLGAINFARAVIAADREKNNHEKTN